MLRVLALLPLAGCASMMAEPTQVLVTSSPPGASFTTSCGLAGITPATITPTGQNKPLVVKYRLEGYRTTIERIESTQSGWAWANCALGPIGLIGLVVDLGSPRAYVLAEDRVHAEMTKRRPPAVLPPAE